MREAAVYMGNGELISGAFLPPEGYLFTKYWFVTWLIDCQWQAMEMLGVFSILAVLKGIKTWNSPPLGLWALWLKFKHETGKSGLGWSQNKIQHATLNVRLKTELKWFSFKSSLAILVLCNRLLSNFRLYLTSEPED